MPRNWKTSVMAVMVGLLAAGCSSEPTPSETEDADLSKKGPAKLRVPIVERVPVGASYKLKLVAARNPQFTAAGLQPVPETLTLDKNTGPEPFLTLMTRLDEEAPAIGAPNGLDLVRGGNGGELEGSFGRGKQGLCYTGDAKLAVALVQSLTDSVFSLQFVLKAWKYKRAAYDADNNPFDSSEQKQYEEDYPDVWKEWRGQGEAILLIASTSDGGEEALATIVSRCR